MKAYGVMETAPMIAMNWVSFSPSERETTEIRTQRRALLVFFAHCLLGDLGQELYKYFSIVVLAGNKTKG